MSSVETGPQNSGIRSVSEPAFRYLANILYDIFPNLDPDGITYTGGGLVIVTGIIEVVNHNREVPSPAVQKLAFAANILGLGADGFDGPYARLLAELGVKRSSSGVLTDTLVDKIEETAMGWTHMLDAWLQNNRFGFEAATLSAATSMLPSIMRALNEVYGIHVPELALGSRLPRVVMGTMGTFVPKLQPYLDITSAAANAYSAFQRLETFRRSKETRLLGIVNQESNDKLNKLLQLYGLTTLGTLSLHEFMIKNPNLRCEILHALGGSEKAIED